jgi:hypothetical protein
MPKGNRIDKVEVEKRIRIVQEWIIDDWPYTDIVTNIQTKWELSVAQAKRYIKAAREKWAEDEQAIIEQKRRSKIESLKKLKRSLKEQYKGTPHGINAVLRIEREIAKMENLYPAVKVDIGNKDGKPFQTESTTKVVLTAKEIKQYAQELEDEV